MTNLRHNPQRDGNEPEIVRALEQVGCTVERLNGKDIPDLLVGRNGTNWLMEVKRERGGKLSDGQADWHRQWRGQVTTVRTVEEALRAIGLE